MEQIRDFIKQHTGVENVLVTFAILLASIFIAIAIHLIFFAVLKRIANRTDRENLHIIRKKIKKPSFYLLLTLVFFVSLPLINFDAYILTGLRQFFSILLIITTAWLAIKAVDIIEDIVVKHYDMNVKDNLKARKISTQLKVFERILIALILIIATASALMTFEKIRHLGVNLLASAGIAGIIVGFAAQKSLTLIISGIQIALTQPFRLDDVVIVENEWGWIEEITLTYVVVRIWDKRRLVVPITYFIDKPFQNWTRVSSDILGTVFIYTDYTVPFDALRKELTRLLENTDRWDGQVNVLQVTDAKESTVEIRALVSAVDSPTAWDLRVYLREKLIEFLQKNYPECLPRSRVILEQKSEKTDKNNQPI